MGSDNASPTATPERAAPESGGWVLVGTYRSGPAAGQPQYHRCDTVIGPCSTPDIESAEVFPTAQAAMESEGFLHWSSSLEPMPLKDALAKARGAQ